MKELLEGVQENNFITLGSLICPKRQINDYFTNNQKNELVTRPSNLYSSRKSSCQGSGNMLRQMGHWKSHTMASKYWPGQIEAKNFGPNSSSEMNLL